MYCKNCVAAAPEYFRWQKALASLKEQEQERVATRHGLEPQTSALQLTSYAVMKLRGSVPFLSGPVDQTLSQNDAAHAGPQQHHQKSGHHQVLLEAALRHC